MGNCGSMFGFGDPQLAENQEIEHTSYGQKLCDSFAGMCLGIFLFFGCLALSGWNEYRNVAMMKSINEASTVYKQATCSPIMSELEGELVHVTCPLSNLQVMGQNDPALQGIPEEERTGLTLVSYMKVNNWVEVVSSKTTEDKVGGGSTTIKNYTYQRTWSTYAPPKTSSFFKSGSQCKAQNYGKECLNWDPAMEPWWSSARYSLGRQNIETATNVKAGDYVLPDDKISLFGSTIMLTPSCSASGGGGDGDGGSNITTPSNGTTTGSSNNTTPNNNTTRALQSSSSANNSNTLSCAPGMPSLEGDQMVWQKQDSNGQTIDYLMRSYTIRTADTVSILALQKGNTFVIWEPSYDEDYGLFVIKSGNKTATELLAEEDEVRSGTTWFLRILTLIGCIVGLVMITAPLTKIPDIIPCVGKYIGDLIGFTLWVVDCMFGCCCWTVVVAICWVVYRPSIGIPLLCVSIAVAVVASFAAYTNHRVKKQNSKMDDEEEEEEDIKVDVEAAPEAAPGQAKTE